MTTQNQPNLLTGLLKGLADLVKRFSPKERAVTAWDIRNFVQGQLREQGTVSDFGEMISAGWVLDAYFDNGGAFCIYTRDDGKLYKVPVTIDEQSQMTLGPESEVFMEFTPVSRSLMIKRETDADGKVIPDGEVRWFAMPACTAFLNRSGEIDSRALFDKFVEYAERENYYPELDFYHLGERLTLGKADTLFRDDVNFCASGTFDDSDIARAAIKSLEERGEFWGTSIAYLPTKEPQEIRSNENVIIPVFNDGICRFISLLPESTAASILTSITTEVNRMNKAQEQALKELTGSDQALFDEIKGKLDTNNRAAKEPGVIVRQQTEAPAVAQAKPASQPAKPAAPVKREFTDEDIEALLGSDKFKAKFDELVSAKAKKDEESESETEAEETEPATVVKENSNPSLESLVMELVTELRKRNQAEQEEADDMPAKIARQKVIRPRGGATMLPADLRSVDRDQIDLSEVANRTLQNIGAA